MGSALTVYAVPFERLLNVRGSKDMALVNQVTRESWRAAEVDRSIADHNLHADDEDDRIPFTFAAAVAQIVAGEPLDDRCGWVYGYALEAICSAMGVQLDDADIHATEPGPIDDVLKKCGAGVRVEALAYRGPPFPMPGPEDYPFIGWWGPDEVTRAAAALERADLSWADPFLVECVTQIRGWFAELAPGEGLVGFVY